MEEAWIGSLISGFPWMGWERMQSREEVGRGGSELAGDHNRLGCDRVARWCLTFEDAFGFLKEIPWSWVQCQQGLGMSSYPLLLQRSQLDEGSWPQKSNRKFCTAEVWSLTSRKSSLGQQRRGQLICHACWETDLPPSSPHWRNQRLSKLHASQGKSLDSNGRLVWTTCE